MMLGLVLEDAAGAANVGMQVEKRCVLFDLPPGVEELIAKHKGAYCVTSLLLVQTPAEYDANQQ